MENNFLESNLIKYINLSEDKPEILMDKIIPAGNLSNLEALEVYRDDYFARLKEAMNHHFPKTLSLISSEDWDDLLIDYIIANPSPFYDLEDYGENLDSFLLNHQNNLIVKYPFLVDIIRFEIKFKKLFHQKSSLGLDTLELQNAFISDQEICLTSTHFIHSSHFPIYNLITQNEIDSNLEDENEKEHILALKKDDKIYIYKLSRPEFLFVNFFQTPSKLSLVLEELEDNLAPQVLEKLIRLLSDHGAFVKN